MIKNKSDNLPDNVILSVEFANDLLKLEVPMKHYSKLDALRSTLIDQGAYIPPRPATFETTTPDPAPEKFGDWVCVQFNKPDQNNRPRPTRDLTYLSDYVRPSSYDEVSDMLGTSGCSREPEMWDWSVMGFLVLPGGGQMLKPGDWVCYNKGFGIRTAMTHAEMVLKFPEDFK